MSNLLRPWRRTRLTCWSTPSAVLFDLADWELVGRGAGQFLLQCWRHDRGPLEGGPQSRTGLATMVLIGPLGYAGRDTPPPRRGAPPPAWRGCWTRNS